MEFKLQKYTNFLSKLKEKLFMLKYEEIKYKSSNSTDESYKKVNNLDIYEFININLQKFDNDDYITIISTNRKLFICSLENNDFQTMSSFVRLFNYLKFVYKLNLFFSNFEKDELFKFNIKEHIANLKQYTQNDILGEISNKLKSNELDIKLLFEMSKNKLQNIKQLSQDNTDFKNLIVEIESELFYFVENFNEKLKELFLVDILNSTNVQNNSFGIINQNSSNSFTHLISQIEKINNFYFYFSRLLMEVKKSVIDIQILSKTGYSEYITTYDVIKRLICKLIRKIEKNFNSKKCLEYQNKHIKALEKKFEDVQSENQELKKDLKEFLKLKNIQIFFCFRCGNILKRAPKILSNCKFDIECRGESTFSCIKCKINFCFNCIVEFSDQQCSKGHLMFSCNNILMESCVICNLNISEDGFVCNLCDLFVCEKCFDILKNLNRVKCNFCHMRMVFQNGGLEKCSFCLDIKECCWKCFFCDYYMCTNCSWTDYSEDKKYCGQLHLMKKYRLDKIEEGNNNKINFKLLESKNSNLKFSMHQISQIRLCSKCEEFLFIEYYFCNRCCYLLCENCYENKV